MLHLVKLRTLHDMGYKVADLKDVRNDPVELEKLILLEATIKAKGKEREDEIIRKLKSRSTK